MHLVHGPTDLVVRLQLPAHEGLNRDGTWAKGGTEGWGQPFHSRWLLTMTERIFGAIGRWCNRNLRPPEFRNSTTAAGFVEETFYIFVTPIPRWFKVPFSIYPSWRSRFTFKRATFSPSQKGHQQNCQVLCISHFFSPKVSPVLSLPFPSPSTGVGHVFQGDELPSQLPWQRLGTSERWGRKP